MKAKLYVLSAMLIFGSIGIFVSFIDLPSSLIALTRGILGFTSLLLARIFLKKGNALAAIRKNLLVLLISGAAIGGNWICLFEAYRHTLVSTATLCYYCAPVLVVLFSPLILRERLTATKALCVFAALVGTALVSNVFGASGGAVNLTGVFYGLSAAVLYAGIIFGNKFLKNIDSMDATITQLLTSALVLLPYVLSGVDFSAIEIDARTVVLLIIVGIVHTGLAYLLYFTGLQKLDSQTSAILSYIDPVSAIILSGIILHERLRAPQWIGAVLILSAALFCSLNPKKKVT